MPCTNRPIPSLEHLTQLVWPVLLETQPYPQTMADTSGAAGIERAWPRT